MHFNLSQRSRAHSSEVSPNRETRTLVTTLEKGRAGADCSAAVMRCIERAIFEHPIEHVCTSAHRFIAKCNLCSDAVLFRALLHRPDLNCRVTQITEAEREAEIRGGGRQRGPDERTISETIRPGSFVIKEPGSQRLVAGFLIFLAILPPAPVVSTYSKRYTALAL